jgi:hypothetical protein
MQYINALCAAKGAGLWALCKDDELLKASGSNGITSHWNSLVRVSCLNLCGDGS